MSTDPSAIFVYCVTFLCVIRKICMECERRKVEKQQKLDDIEWNTKMKIWSNNE